MYAVAVRLAPQETRTYHVTTATADRRSLFQVTAAAELLEQTLLDYWRQGKYALHAWAIMHDHVHLLITPSPEVSLEKAVQFIKGGFSFSFKSKWPVWTRSFNETRISSERMYVECVRYIEQNPVRRGLVSEAVMYRFSSAANSALDPMPAHMRGSVESAKASRA